MNIWSFFPLFFILINLPWVFWGELTGSTEARELTVILSILKEGDWILPFRFEMLPSKPPFYHWIATIFGTPFGVDVWTGRLTALFFGAGILYLIQKFLKEVAPEIEKLSISILATSYLFLTQSINARVDIALAFCVTGAVLAGLKVLILKDEPGKFEASQDGVTYFWIFSAFGVLAKGPLGIVLPFLIVMPLAFYRYRVKGLIQFFEPVTGIVSFLVITISWYYFAWRIGGDPFLERHLFFENINRAITKDPNLKIEPIYYYLQNFFGLCPPWSFFLVYFIFFPKVKIKDNILNLSSLVWLVSPFILFSLATGKRASYLLPILPGVAIFLGIQINQLVKELSLKELINIENRVLKPLFFIGVFIIIAIFSILEGSCFYLSENPDIALGLKYFKENHLILSLSLLSLSLLIYLVKKIDFNYALVLLYILLLGFSIKTGLGIKGYFKGFDQIALEVQKYTINDPDLIVIRPKYNEYLDPVLFYLYKNSDRKIITQEELEVTRTGKFIVPYNYNHTPFLDLGCKEVIRFTERYQAKRGAIVLNCNKL